MNKTVVQQIPIAEWIPVQIGLKTIFECECCGTYKYKKTNYCPECGAIMCDVGEKQG